MTIERPSCDKLGAMEASTARPRLTLEHCVIAVSDWQRSNAFYRDVRCDELVEFT